MIRMVDEFGTISTVVNNSSGLKSPTSLAFSPTGELFIADYESNRIKKITFS